MGRAFLLLAIAGVGLAGVYFFAVAAAGARDKDAYATLQGIELDNRGKQLTTPILLHKQGRAGDVLGLQSGDPRFPYCWVSVTTLSASGGVLDLDCGKFRDACASIDHTMRDRKTPPVIQSYLDSRCVK